jgi:hypothetical protein
MFLFGSDAACLKAKREFKKRRKGSYDFRLKALVWDHPHMPHPDITIPIIALHDDPLTPIVNAARRRGIAPLYIVRLKRFK